MASALLVESSGPAAVVVDSVDLSYGSVQILFGVSLTVGAGSIVALLGSNGAGKTSILRLVSGLLLPSAGSITMWDEDVTKTDVRGRVSRGTVLVPEVKGVFPDLSVAENMDVGAFTLRKDRGLRAERMAAAYDLFPRLAERRNQHAATLSGGERQMLALAKAFLLQPKLLLIDELSLGLSPSMVDLLVESVKGFVAIGTSMLVVEQSINVAQAIADYAVVVEKGQVQFAGPMSRFKEQPDLMRSVLLGGHGEAV
jgi:ABC-type branched-subunit amino acid transport system ATPase component